MTTAATRPAGFENGREGGDPRAARVGVDPRVPRHPVLERPPEGIDELGGQRNGISRASGPLALHDEPRSTGGRVEVAERLDGRGEQHLVLDGHQALLELPVGGRARIERPLRLGVKPRVDEEGGHPRDVEELGAHRVLHLALLPLVGEEPDRADGEQRHDREEAGEPDAEALPRTRLVDRPGRPARLEMVHGPIGFTRAPARFARRWRIGRSPRRVQSDVDMLHVIHNPRSRRSAMKKTHLFVASAMVAALTLPFASKGQGGPAPKPRFEAEKCYGVAKAGKNDCQTANSSCAGTSQRDGQGDAWIYVPKGACERLVNGSLQPRA